MNPIHFQGMNCYHDCVISIANYFGLNYPASFATLWSETEFDYDPYHETYLTKRMIANLEVLGGKIEKWACHSQEDTDRNISLFHEGAFIIVGIDAFYIPWNQLYHTFHGPHYFIVRNAETDKFFCVDPTYGKKSEQIARREIIAHTYEIVYLNRVAKKPLQIEAIQEAREIVRIHPNTRQTLLSHIHGCINGERENIILLAKYIDAMIQNRYLYRFFLENQPMPCDENHLFLNSDFFLKWKAVKNGLYKASVSKRNERIINDVCDHFNHLIDEEIAMAEKIICGV